MAFIDLTTAAAVSAWLNQASTIDTALIQSIVTGYSQYILTLLDRTYMGGIMQYNEKYDGNGSTDLMVKNYPVLAINSLAINGIAIPPSPDGIQAGWVIDQGGSGAGIALVGGGTGYRSLYDGYEGIEMNGNAPPLGAAPYRFFYGRQNVAISYIAGSILTAGMEEQKVSSSSPYTVTAANAASFWEDLGATDTNGAPLSGYTVGAPFTATAGVYTFPASMAGQNVLLNYKYGGVPQDLAQVATVLCATAYRRRKWIDQTAQIQPGVGNTTFSKEPIPPECRLIINHYARTFLD